MANHIAQVRQRIAALRAELEAGKRELEAAEEYLAKLEALPAGRVKRIMSDVDVDTTGKDLKTKIGAGRATRKGAAQRALYEAGTNLTGLAAILGEKRSRVSAWFASGTSQRPIPRRHYETIRAQYGEVAVSGLRVAD